MMTSIRTGFGENCLRVIPIYHFWRGLERVKRGSASGRGEDELPREGELNTKIGW